MTSSLSDSQVGEALSVLDSDCGGGRFELSIHPFPARMPLSVAEHLVKRLTGPGEIVLDPMAGSGTTLIAAARHGRRGVGFERDPLAVLIARTTTRGLESETTTKLEACILERAKELFRTSRLPDVRGRLPREDQVFLRYWFPSRSQKQLFSLAGAIEELPDGQERDFAWVVFSSLIVAKSAGASFALDVPRSRPHKQPDKQIVLPFEGWPRRFKTAFRRHPFREQKPVSQSRVSSGDARSLPLQDETVDLVLTSPPYLNAIDYLRAHKFSLLWMGHNLADLRELRGTMIGSERGLWSRDGLPEQLEERLKSTVAVDRRRALLRRYLSDFRTMLKEVHRVLRPGGLGVLVVGTTIVAGDEHDAVGIVSELAESVDLKIVGSALRTITSDRRSLPPPSPNASAPLDKRMRQEVLVALRK